MKKFNILVFMVDEERYPVAYETKEIKEWRKNNLKAQEFLMENGFEFKNHYTASAACVPSRVSFCTGQYPTIHGASQTPGLAKGDFDSDTYWLDPNTAPTFGNYLRAGGYRTFWKGKWHVSQADIIEPGPGHTPYSSYNEKGVPDPIAEERYLKADKLYNFGFSGWVGPEPFGKLAVNSGSSSPYDVSGRDVVYANEAIELIKKLDSDTECDKPWLIVTSFVNPHDITLYGEGTKGSANYKFVIDESVPTIEKAPTSDEDLSTKPSCQKSYKLKYQESFQPTKDTEEYRKLYYSLQLQADREMEKVIDALRTSSFYEDTIIIFTSDHGDLGGAHGGLFQKWYQAYEEAIHVPLIVHNPKLFKGYNSTESVTSHIDILPTLLSLAEIDVEETMLELEKSHTLVREPIGRDLTKIMFSKDESEILKDAVYFRTDDNITKGKNQVSVMGNTYKSVKQPSSIETIIVHLENPQTGKLEKWKFSRYYNNSELWTNPNSEDKNLDRTIKATDSEVDIYSINKNNEYEEFEMYNLNKDSIETHNLMNYYRSNQYIKNRANKLYKMLVLKSKEVNN